MPILYHASLRMPFLAPRTTSSAYRNFSKTAYAAYSQPPHSEGPPSAKAAGKSNHPAEDAQSSASSKDPAESASGDDHPAKQPDTQAESDRSTGFHEVKGGVEGGKEGLKHRSDKQ